jgi:hypothetical protein
MATSISKLAIMLTADTTGLNTGLTRAQAAIKGFGMKMNANGAGNFLGMFARGGAVAAGAAAIGLSLAGVYQFLKLGVTAGAQFEQAMTDSLDTLSGKTQALRDAFTGLAVAVTGPLRDGLGELAIRLSRVIDWGTKALGGMTGAEMKKQVAAREALVKSLKDQEAAAQKAADAHKRLVESMRERGASIEESLRTPVEVFADTMNELRELGSKGFIDPETFARGTAKARADLISATKLAKEFKSQTNFSVGAVERFSSAGASAVNAGRAELTKIVEFEKAQLEEQKRQTKLLEEANALERTRKPVVFQRSSL